MFNFPERTLFNRAGLWILEFKNELSFRAKIHEEVLMVKA
jgi:hypothetical protein